MRANVRRSLMVAVPVLALILTTGIVLTHGDGDDQQHGNIAPNGPDIGGGDDCICPQVYDPVVCVAGGNGSIGIGGAVELVEYSNACFAGCDGYTQCRPVERRD